MHLEYAIRSNVLRFQGVLVGSASGKQGGEQENGWKEFVHRCLTDWHEQVLMITARLAGEQAGIVLILLKFLCNLGGG